MSGMMMRLMVATALCLLALPWAMPLVAGEVPAQLTHHGLISDSNGEPVDGELEMAVALYAAPEGGAPLWQEELGLVKVERGFYFVLIGKSGGLVPVVAGNSQLFLELRIEGEVGKPRQVVGSVPFALVAADVVGEIHPAGVHVGGKPVIDGAGKWVGDTTGMGGVQSVTALAPLTGGAITTAGAIGLPPAGVETDGYLAAGDWAWFAGKQEPFEVTCKVGYCVVAIDPLGAVCEPCVGAGAVGPAGLADWACQDGEVVKWDGALGQWGCGTDEEGVVSAGSGLELTDGSLSLLLSCAPGNVLAWSGSAWQCQAPLSSAGGTVTLVETVPPLLGGPIVGEGAVSLPAAGQGQDGYLKGQDWSTFDGKQSRVVGSCDKGSSIRVVKESGEVECEIDDNTMYLAGPGLVTKGAELSLLLTCASGNILKWSGSNWECAPDDNSGGLVTLVDTLPPLYGGPFTQEGAVGIMQSSTTVDGYLAAADYAAFAAKQQRVTGKCPPGKSIREISVDGSVICETDDMATYTAGAGLEVAGTELKLAPAYLDGSAFDDRFVNEGQPGSISEEMVQDGSITATKLGEMGCADGEMLKWDEAGQLWHCATDLDTTYDGTNFALANQTCTGTQKVSGVDESGGLVCSDGIPPGAILMFNSSCPAGWTRVAALDDRFPRGGPSFGQVGGSDSHSHGAGSFKAPSHTHTFSDTVSQTTSSSGTHAHTVANHNHSIPNHSHTLSAHTHNCPAHTHSDGSLFAAIGTVGNNYLAFNSVSSMFGANTRAGTTGQEKTTEACYGVDVAGSTGSWGGATGGPSVNQTGEAGAGSTGSSAPGTDTQGAHTHVLSDYTASGTTSLSGGEAVSGTSATASNVQPYMTVVFCLKNQ